MEGEKKRKKKMSNNKEKKSQIVLNHFCIITGSSRKFKIIFLIIYKR